MLYYHRRQLSMPKIKFFAKKISPTEGLVSFHQTNGDFESILLEKLLI